MQMFLFGISQLKYILHLGSGCFASSVNIVVMESLQKGEALSMELDLRHDREKDIFSVGLEDS